MVPAQAVQQGRQGVTTAGGATVMAGAAIVGGVAAGAMLGTTAAVVAAGGCAYAATRSDDVGDGNAPLHNILDPSQLSVRC